MLAGRCFHSSAQRLSNVQTIGFIGLGHMGGKMVENLANDGHKLLVYDKSEDAVAKATAMRKSITASSVAGIAKEHIILSMLPNDTIVNAVSADLIKGNTGGSTFTHISCSTISPKTARRLEELHKESGHTFITAPVFARPDGLAKRQATWMIGGEESGRSTASALLSTIGSSVVDMGEDVGAANVVKLCGNFLIASSIEAIGEAMVLSEKNGVDREKVMGILSSTIFDCLIYKGYGSRVSQRDHRPGGFSLELGRKDVGLVSQAAMDSDTPMPFLSVLLDRYTSAKAKGRKDMDWSAIGLSIAEEAGVNVEPDVQRNAKAVENNDYYQ